MKKNAKLLILSLIAAFAFSSALSACVSSNPESSKGNSQDVESSIGGNESVGGSEEEEVSISLAATESVVRFETKQLTATVKGTQEKLVWASSNSTVATVDENGLVSALTLGEAVITASVGDVSASCTLTVVETDIPHEIEISLEEISVFEGKTSEEITVGVSYDGEDVEGDFVYTWSLVEGDEDVVSIEEGENGASVIFNGLKPGTVTYEIYTEARGYEAAREVTITVKENVYSLGISNENILVVGNGYAVDLVLGTSKDAVTFGDAYLIVNGTPLDENITVSWSLDDSGNATFADGTLAAVKAGTAVLTGTTTYKEKPLTVTLTATIRKGEVTLDDTDMLETAATKTFTLPAGVDKGEVEKVYIGEAVLFDKANAKGSIEGNVVTLDSKGMPVKDEDLGKGKTLIIETNLIVYTMTVDVYTMIIDSAEELDTWQEVAAENAVKAGICIEAQKGLAYNGYFILGDNIKYNKEWKTYKKYGDLWGLCYNNAGIWKELPEDGKIHSKVPAADNMVEGAIIEDWGAGDKGGFQGVFDGNGYAIEGLNIQGQYVGFVTTMGRNGIVKNIAFTKTKIGAEAGLIERGGRGGLVENVYVEVTEMASNAHLITMHGWTNMTNVIVNVTDCSFYGVEKSYFLNLAYVEAKNVYVIDRDALVDTKQDFDEDVTSSAFFHFNKNNDIGGKFATVEALLADETHSAIIAEMGGLWKLADGKLYFGDMRVATSAERITDETEYKTNEENKVVFENEAYTVGSEWTLSVGGVESTVTVAVEGKVEVELDPATVNGYRTVVTLSSEEKVFSYPNVIAVTYIYNAEELKALGVGGQVGGEYTNSNGEKTTVYGKGNSHVTGNDLKGYYMLADDIDCADAGIFAAGYSYQQSYFKGVFDGNNKTISNITVTEGGIFGGLSGAVVKNVNFTGVKYNAQLGNYGGFWGNYTALFAQYANNGTVIENINVTVAETNFAFGNEPIEEGLLFVNVSYGVVVKNVTVDASYLNLDSALGKNLVASNVTFENCVVKAASYTQIGFGADKVELIEWPEGVTFQTVAHLGILNTETTVALGGSLTIQTTESLTVTLSLKEAVDGVTLEGNVVSVAETVAAGTSFTVVATAGGASAERTFTVTKPYTLPTHYAMNAKGQNLPQFANEASLGFAQGTYVFEATTADLWTDRIMIPANPSEYDYVEFDFLFPQKMGYLTAWPATSGATAGSMTLNGHGMRTSDGAIRTVELYDANGNMMPAQYHSGFNANTIYTLRFYFNAGEEALNSIHLGTSTALTYYVANIRWGNLGVSNNVYNSSTGALLAKYDGDVTAVGFDAGSVVTKVDINDGWSSRVGFGASLKYDYVDVEFALGDSRTIDSLTVWAYKPDASILTGHYALVPAKCELKDGAPARTVQILDANGNEATEWKANTVYTLRIYINAGTDSAAIAFAFSTFQTSAESVAVMYFGDITYGNVAN